MKPIFSTSKETEQLIPGPAGQLQIRHFDSQTLLDNKDPRRTLSTHLAIVCHPNPTQGGTMLNKVVTSLCQAYANAGIQTLRFNFRGVGRSQGDFAATKGEQEDLMAVLDWAHSSISSAEHLMLAGFSFGSFIAAQIAKQLSHEEPKPDSNLPLKHTLLVAPPVNMYEFPQSLPSSLDVIQPMADEVVPATQVVNWFNQQYPELNIHQFADCSHFFHGQLIALREKVAELLQAHLHQSPPIQ